MKIMDFRRRLHTRGQDDADFQPYKRLEPATGDKYYGLMNADGEYVIIKELDGATDETFTLFYYGKGGTASFNTAWTAKTTLNYSPINELLG